MNRFSKELIESLTEACEHAEGKPSAARVHVVEVPDVRAIRRQLRMSQQEFARVYEIPLATLKNWEQGRRQPDAPAAAYLQVIARNPLVAREKLQGAGVPSAIVSKKDVIAFGNACVHARSIYMHYRAIYEETEIGAHPLKTVSPFFFGDLNHMLREYIILQVCKLTDPASDARGNENLTIEFFTADSALGANSEAMLELRKRVEKIRQFRAKLKPARDKIISHYDRASIMKGTPLGGADSDAWTDFWLDLQVFVKVLYDRYVGPSFYMNGVAGMSDAVSLVQVLRVAIVEGRPIPAKV